MNYKFKLLSMAILLGLGFSSINVCMAAGESPTTSFYCKCPSPLTSDHCECYSNSYPGYTDVNGNPINSIVPLVPNSDGTTGVNIKLYCTSPDTLNPPGANHADFTHSNEVTCHDTYDSRVPGNVFSNFYCESHSLYNVTVHGYDCFK